jgi:putative RecB family exonuclease
MAIKYSKSMIEAFEKCPRQYKFAYIERASVEKPVSVEAFLGNAVHYALERLYRFKMDGRLQTIEEMLADYHKYWEGPDKDKIKVTRENLGVDEYIKVGHDSLIKYYEKYEPFDDGAVLALEKKFFFPLDPAHEFSLSGKIDRVNRRHDGVIEIIDYKTSAALPSQQVLDNDTQMALYQMGVKYMWPDFDKFELHQIFLRQGVTLSTTMDDDKIEEIRYRSYQKILDVEQAKTDDNFPTKESSICDWCLYYELCPAKRHRLALAKEEHLEFDADTGRELAKKYIELDRKINILKSQKDTIKEDIYKFCSEMELTRLDGEQGYLMVKIAEISGFPSKTKDSKAFMEISYLARQAGLEECFKLEEGVLFKEFYSKGKLPPELKDKLNKYVIVQNKNRITPRYKKDSEGEAEPDLEE